MDSPDQLTSKHVGAVFITARITEIAESLPGSRSTTRKMAPTLPLLQAQLASIPHSNSAS